MVSGIRLVLTKLLHLFRSEQHVIRRYSAFPAVCQIQIAVAARDVVARRKAQQPRGAVYPARAAFNLQIIADGRFIHQHLPGGRSLGVLGAELLVAKNWMIAELMEDLLHLEGIRQHHFNLMALLVSALLGGTLVSKQRVRADPAETNQLAVAAQHAAG